MTKDSNAPYTASEIAVTATNDLSAAKKIDELPVLAKDRHFLSRLQRELTRPSKKANPKLWRRSKLLLRKLRHARSKWYKSASRAFQPIYQKL